MLYLVNNKCTWQGLENFGKNMNKEVLSKTWNVRDSNFSFHLILFTKERVLYKAFHL